MGRDSAVRWSRPFWATEAYLWWLCSSMTLQPGEHVAKGVNRLRTRFFSEAPDTIDGVIFHNELCGTPRRPCPKSERIEIAGRQVPPPCIYVMPDRAGAAGGWNWGGDTIRRFPSILLPFFGVAAASVPMFTGYIGFQSRGGDARVALCSRFGSGRSTTYRT